MPGSTRAPLNGRAPVWLGPSMRIAIISTYTHPTRQRIKEASIMQSSVPELIAGLCPPHVEVEIYNEKEIDIPLDKHWDLVFFSYLHSYYEHTKVLSALFRQRGIVTVAGGRHAGHFPEDCQKYFDAVVIGEPEANVPALLQDFERGSSRSVYSLPSLGPEAIRPARYDLIDFTHNSMRLPGIEASRGCPFKCNFCVLTGHERYRYRPIKDVIDEIQTRMVWNPQLPRRAGRCLLLPGQQPGRVTQVPARAVRGAQAAEEDLGLRAHLQHPQG